jgi:hypothetical protein
MLFLNMVCLTVSSPSSVSRSSTKCCDPPSERIYFVGDVVEEDDVSVEYRCENSIDNIVHKSTQSLPEEILGFLNAQNNGKVDFMIRGTLNG